MKQNNKHPMFSRPSKCLPITAITALSAGLFATGVVNGQDVDNAAAAQADFQKGKREFQSKNYKEAQRHLAHAATLSSRSSTIQYYLGLAAAQNGDYVTFKRAMTCIVAMNHTRLGIGKQALDMLNKYTPGCQPYSALSPSGTIMRFIKRQMPIKIYVSQGQMLPAPYRGKTLGRMHIPPLMALLRQANFYTTLERDPNYHGYNQCVIRALHSWDWARTEGIIDYKLVQSPLDADVYVFWCPKFDIANMAGYTADLTVGKQTKVILELATSGNVPANNFSDFITVFATHELGHCWGLEGHNPNPDSIMSEKVHWQYSRNDGGADAPKCSITENDKITLRALYCIAPDVVK